MTQPATPQQPATNSHSVANSHYHHTRWFLIAYYALAVIWGVRSIWYWEASRVDLVASLGFTIALGWWAIVDARRRRQPIPVLARPWFFLLAGLVVPGYIVWSRGWVGIGWIVLNGVLWYVLATIVMHIGGFIVFGDEWLNALGLQ